MKRIKTTKIIFMLAFIILLTGCQNNLKCTIKTNNYTSQIKITYKNDKPIEYKYEDKMMFSPQDPEAEIYYHSKYEEYGTLIAEKHARMGNHTDNITLKIHYDFTKNNSQQENKLLISRNDTPKNAITKIESLGYKCK